MVESYYLRKKRERREQIQQEQDLKDLKRKKKNKNKTRKMTKEQIMNTDWNSLTELKTYLENKCPDVHIMAFDGMSLHTSIGCFALCGLDLSEYNHDSMHLQTYIQ